MKFYIFLLSFSYVLQAHSGLADSLEPFVGEYKLTNAIYETSSSFWTRGAKCREELKVYFSEDKNSLFLSGSGQSGITVNWIDLSENSQTKNLIESNSVTQSRLWSPEGLFGWDRQIYLVTTLKNENNKLVLRYAEETYTALTKKTSVGDESICEYQLGD